MESSFVVGMLDLLMGGGSGRTLGAFLRNLKLSGFDLDWWSDHTTGWFALQVSNGGARAAASGRFEPPLFNRQDAKPIGAIARFGLK